MANYRENNYSRTQSRIEPARSPAPAPDQAQEQAPDGEKKIPVNGYQQVVEMLAAADPAFRESLLRRLAARDPELGRSLRAHFS